jgi:hypothetical protein
MTPNPLLILRILWSSLFAGQFMILGITTIIDTKNVGDFQNLTIPIVVLGLSIAVLGKFIIFPKILKTNMQNIQASKNNENNIDENTAYRNAFIVSCAIMEGGNLLMIVFHFLTKNPAYLVGIFIGLLLFLTQMPMPDTIKNQIENAKK